MPKLLARARTNERGYTMIELLMVMIIMTTVVTSLTALFVSGSRASVELNQRFEAQQAARVAADKIRREGHCSSGVTFTSAASITVVLPGHCPTAVGGVPTSVVYATELVSTGRYRLKRGTVIVADHLTNGNVFAYTAPSDASLGKLQLDFPVNLMPTQSWKTWRLRTDVVLRNTLRDP
jgi:prepilin-type N-terminal cleavage/methylation domain-containing protein